MAASQSQRCVIDLSHLRHHTSLNRVCVPCEGATAIPRDLEATLCPCFLELAQLTLASASLGRRGRCAVCRDGRAGKHPRCSRTPQGPRRAAPLPCANSLHRAGTARVPSARRWQLSVGAPALAGSPAPGARRPPVGRASLWLLRPLLAALLSSVGPERLWDLLLRTRCAVLLLPFVRNATYLVVCDPKTARF